MAFFNHNGDRYYYFDIGSGEAVLLIHGLCNSGRAWEAQLTDMIKQGYRVIIPDLLGHGASAPLNRRFTAQNQAEALVALLGYLGLKNAITIGLSLGGMVALEMAINHPKAVKKLVVAGSFLTLATDDRQKMLDRWIKGISQPNGCISRLEAGWAGLVGGKFSKTPTGLACYQAWHAQAAMQNPQSLIHWCEGMKLYDSRENLAKITTPTLILAGEKDPMIPIPELQEIAHRITAATFKIVPSEGHVFNVSSAAQFNQHVGDFLQGNAHE